VRRRPSRPPVKTPGRRLGAHTWEPRWLYVTVPMGGPKHDVGRFLPDDHGLPFEIASEKLRRAW
jgi:hypothetical protein